MTQADSNAFQCSREADSNVFQCSREAAGPKLTTPSTDVIPSPVCV